MKMFALAILLTSHLSWAGNEGGGGDAKSCWAGNIRLADVVETQKDHPLIWLFDERGSSEIIKATLDFIALDNEQYSQRIQENLKALKFEYQDKKLEDLKGDEFKLGLIDSIFCKKKQLAIQDLRTGLVRVDLRVYKKMAALEKGLLHIHEALVRMEYLETNLHVQDTRSVRAKVQKIIAKPEYFPFLVEKTLMEDRGLISTISFYQDVFVAGLKYGASISRMPLEIKDDLIDRIGSNLESELYPLGRDANFLVQSQIIEILKASGACKPFQPEKRDLMVPVKILRSENFSDVAYKFGSRVCPLK